MGSSSYSSDSAQCTCAERAHSRRLAVRGADALIYTVREGGTMQRAQARAGRVRTQTADVSCFVTGGMQFDFCI